MNKAHIILIFMSISTATLANETANTITSGARSKMLNHNAAAIIHYNSASLPESNYADGNMKEAAQKLLNEKTGPATIAEGAFMYQKGFAINPKDSTLNRAYHAQKNPYHYVNWLSGEETKCEANDESLSSTQEIKVCDEFHTIQTNTCSVGHTIKVEPFYNYRCVKNLKQFRKLCTQKLQVYFEQHQDCDDNNFINISGGGYKATYPNLNISSEYGKLHIESAAPFSNRTQWARSVNYGYNSVISFDIRDLNAIQSLLLDYVQHAPYTDVLLNDHVIFTDNKYTNTYTRVRCSKRGHDDYNCYNEVSGPDGLINFDKLNHISSLKQTQLRLELKPFLIAGRNTIIFKSWSNQTTTLQIKTQQHCLKEKEIWTESCIEEEQAI